MKVSTKKEKAQWLQDAATVSGSRVWGNPLRPNINYSFVAFSDTTNEKTVTRKGKTIEITERFIFVTDGNKEFELNTKFCFVTYNETEDLQSPIIYGIGDGLEDPVQLLFEAVESKKGFTIEYFDAYSLDFEHWEKTKERKLKLNEKAIKFNIE